MKKLYPFSSIMPNDSPQFPLIYRVMEDRRWHICKIYANAKYRSQSEKDTTSTVISYYQFEHLFAYYVQCTASTFCYSITFDFFFTIQPNVQWLLKMQWTTASYTNHSPDEPMDARCSKNTNIFEIPPKNQIYFSLFQKTRNMKCV